MAQRLSVIRQLPEDAARLQNNFEILGKFIDYTNLADRKLISKDKEVKLDFVNQYISLGTTPPTAYGNNAGIFIGVESSTAKMSLYSSPAQYFKFDGTNVYISGTLYASAGAIGGWLIGSSTLNSVNSKISLDSANERISINNTTYGQAGVQMEYSSAVGKMYVGNGLATTNARFLEFDGTNLSWQGVNTSLTAAGAFTATNATITGSITADTGYIGGTSGWTISSKTITGAADSKIVSGILQSSDWGAGAGSQIDLVNKTMKFGGSSAPKFSVAADGTLTATGASISGAISASTIDIGGADTTSMHVDTDGNMWLGAAAYNIATNPFAVSKAGLLHSTSGDIGGWTLASTCIYYDGTLDANSAGMARTDYPFYAGKKYADRATAPFRVTPAGALVATNATISGAITASTIDIGGADATSFHVDVNGNIWSGAAAIGDAPFSATNDGTVTFRHANLFIEDDNSDTISNVGFGNNLLRDHNFENVQANTMTTSAGAITNTPILVSQYSEAGTKTLTSNTYKLAQSFTDTGNSCSGVTIVAKCADWNSGTITARIETPIGTGTNIAATATATASSEYSADWLANNLNDGVIVDTPGNCYASSGEANPWVKYTWGSGQTIGAVHFYDRTSAENVNGGTLTFSDGSDPIYVTEIPTAGTARYVTFTPRTGITWIKFQVVGGVGTNNGFQEIQVYSASGTTPSGQLVESNATATVTTANWNPIGTTSDMSDLTALTFVLNIPFSNIISLYSGTNFLVLSSSSAATYNWTFARNTSDTGYAGGTAQEYNGAAWSALSYDLSFAINGISGAEESDSVYAVKPNGKSNHNYISLREWCPIGMPRMYWVDETDTPYQIGTISGGGGGSVFLISDKTIYDRKTMIVNSANCVQQRLQVAPSTEFTLSCTAAPRGGSTGNFYGNTNASNLKCRLYTYYYKSDGSSAGAAEYTDTTIDASYTDATDRNKTVRATHTFTTPADTDHILVKIMGDSTEWIRVDGAQLVGGDTSLQYNAESNLFMPSIGDKKIASSMLDTFTPWTKYTPAWTGSTTNPVIGNGTLTGAYQQIGKTVHLRIRMFAGNTTTFGSGFWFFSVPIQANGDGAYSTGFCLTDDSGTLSYFGMTLFSGLNNIFIYNINGTNAIYTATVPFTWTTNDSMFLSLTYEGV